VKNLTERGSIDQTSDRMKFKLKLEIDLSGGGVKEYISFGSVNALAESWNRSTKYRYFCGANELDASMFSYLRGDFEDYC